MVKSFLFWFAVGAISNAIYCAIRCVVIEIRHRRRMREIDIANEHIDKAVSAKNQETYEFHVERALWHLDGKDKD